MQFSECYYNTILYSNTVTTCTPQYSVDISVDSIFVFVPGVTRGNKDVGSVEDCIFLFLLFVLIKGIRGRVSIRFPTVTPVVESFPWDLLQAIVNYFALGTRCCKCGGR